MAAMNTMKPSNIAPAPGWQEPKRIRAEDLMGQASVVVIEYQGERYQLRLTRNGKLILTK